MARRNSNLSLVFLQIDGSKNDLPPSFSISQVPALVMLIPNNSDKVMEFVIPNHGGRSGLLDLERQLHLMRSSLLVDSHLNTLIKENEAKNIIIEEDYLKDEL